MAKVQFKKRRFQAKAAALVAKCDEVLTALVGAGYRPTLRQLYYQLVKDNIIANEMKEYKNLVRVMTAAREHGLIDWNHLFDPTRVVQGYYKNTSPEQAIADAAASYEIDLWEGQDNYVEVWVEKDALKDVISKPAARWQVPYFSCRGYTSASSMYQAHLRLARKAKMYGMNPIIIHVGDHDPSGIQMTDDIIARHNELFGGSVEVDRIALNLDQVRERDLPPNPAKQSDSRYKAYCDQFGVDDSWELDALAPSELDDLIDRTILDYMDLDLYNTRVQIRDEQQQTVEEISNNYEFVTDVLREHTFIDEVLARQSEIEDYMNNNL